MATDPGDLVLDPTCGSGTTAAVAEQWGRRWITIDTSRVALALARTRIMAARHPYYLLADSPEGRAKEAQLTGKPGPDTPTHNDLRQGFVYDRAPHVTLKSIANNAEIDVLWNAAQPGLEADSHRSQRRARHRLGGMADPSRPRRGLADQGEPAPRRLVGRPHRPAKASSTPASPNAPTWSSSTTAPTRTSPAPASLALSPSKASLPTALPPPTRPKSPTSSKPRPMAAPRSAPAAPPRPRTSPPSSSITSAPPACTRASKADSIHFTTLTPWPGDYIAAEGRYTEAGPDDETPGLERRAAILVGPEFGTLTRLDLVAAAREASEARFDVLVACAFNYDAHAADLTRLGPLPILKARMNPDLHMADDLKNTGKGNLFVVFGEPDVEIRDAGDGQIEVQIHGVDVFDLQTGDIRSGGTEEHRRLVYRHRCTTRRASASVTPTSSAPTTRTSP